MSHIFCRDDAHGCMLQERSCMFGRQMHVLQSGQYIYLQVSVNHWHRPHQHSCTAASSWEGLMAHPAPLATAQKVVDVVAPFHPHTSAFKVLQRLCRLAKAPQQHSTPMSLGAASVLTRHDISLSSLILSVFLYLPDDSPQSLQRGAKVRDNIMCSAYTKLL